jgi:RNA polymerase sigma-70 factor (ECF subfamily)
MDERGENIGEQHEVKSDAELHADAIAGGPEAFGPIVERYKDAVFGIALARVRDFHAAEDVAQSVLIAAYERLGSLKDPSRLGAWLRSMTIHQSIDHLRTRRPVGEARGATMASSDEREPGAHLERKELRERVLAAIGRLSKAQGETTTLFYINGYSVAEVAAIQEMPLGTIKSRLHDARESLREELIGMVEDVLKSEAPKEDFAERVFKVLSCWGKMGWWEIVAELERIGSRGAQGYARALE